MEVKDKTQAITSASLSNESGPGEPSDASDTSDVAEFGTNTNDFKTTQDGFETNATIEDPHFIS